MDAEEASELYTMLDYLARMVEARRLAVRERLLKLVAVHGKMTDGRGQRLAAGVGEVYRKVTEAEVYDLKATEELLDSLGLQVDKVIVPKPVKPSYVVSGARLKELRDRGFLSDAQLAALLCPPKASLQIVEHLSVLDELEATAPPLPLQERKGRSEKP